MDLRRLRPMLAVPGSLADVRDGFAHEFKWDGVRVLLHADDGRLTLRSRTGGDVTGRYPELHGLAAPFAGRTALLDGEVVAFDAAGRPSFAALQARMHLADPARAAAAARHNRVAVMLFDLLHLDGDDLLEVPYEARRDRLLSLGLRGPSWQVPPAADDLRQALDVAAAQGLEGVVAKRLGSPYRPGARSRDWRKLKLTRRQEMLVGGWRPEQQTGAGIGSLLVGYLDDHGLRYAGGVGSGLTSREVAALRDALTPTDHSPFVDPVPHRDAHFALPTVVVEVRFGEWTPDGRLRHPVYLGRRSDVDPATVRRET